MKQFITDGKRVVKEDTKLEPLEVTTIQNHVPVPVHSPARPNAREIEIRIGARTQVNPGRNIKTWPRHTQIRTDYESNERKSA
jgi:hypothetical protein